MNVLRTTSLVLALVAAMLLVSGTLGFSSVTADRGTHVNVADDDSAYVGYDTSAIGDVESGDTVDLVDVTNRFTEGTDLQVTNADIEVTSGDIEISEANLPDTIPVGESRTITGEVSECSPGASATVQVTINVEGTDVQAEVFGDVEYREFEIDCKPQADFVEGDSISVSTISGSGGDRQVDISLNNPQSVEISDIAVEPESNNITFTGTTTDIDGSNIELAAFSGFSAGGGQTKFVDPGNADIRVTVTFGDGSERVFGIKVTGVSGN
jgi:hypothetical protein